MAKVILNGMTMKQARLFAEWYGEQGEQDADAYFDAQYQSAPYTTGPADVDFDEEIVTLQVH